MRTNDIFAIVSQCYTCSQFMHVHTHICWKSNVIRKSKFLKKINDFRFYAFRIQRIRVRDRFYRPTDNSDAYLFFLFTVLALWFFREGWNVRTNPNCRYINRRHYTMLLFKYREDLQRRAYK